MPQTVIRISIEYHRKLDKIKEELRVSTYREAIEKLIDLYELWKPYKDLEALVMSLETARDVLNTIRKIIGLQAYQSKR
jgi:predicted DNA-binding protein